METIFTKTEKSKTNEPHRFRLILANKLNLKDPNKNRTFANLSIYHTQKNIKSEYNSNTFKISPPTWNDKFDLLNGSYSISDIQDYFEYIADDPPVQICTTKIKNKTVFKIKTGYKLELLSPERMK